MDAIKKKVHNELIKNMEKDTKVPPGRLPKIFTLFLSLVINSFMFLHQWKKSFLIQIPLGWGMASQAGLVRRAGETGW